jgi:2-isopropylmalate synthase
MSTPNVYADQIEWFCDHVARAATAIISLHTHNDRGCAVAASELGVLAGADRVEGTLLGNGERTGNMDIVTMAMNLYSQGVDPQLDLSGMDEIIETVKEPATSCRCTRAIPGPASWCSRPSPAATRTRSRSAWRAARARGIPWEVAYLPIDPADIGRSYQEVIRINSQSGKGGVAYVMHADHGFDLPRWLQIDFSPTVQAFAEDTEVGGQLRGDLHPVRADLPAPEPRWHLHDYQLSRAGGVDRLQVRSRGQRRHSCPARVTAWSPPLSMRCSATSAARSCSWNTASTPCPRAPTPRPCATSSSTSTVSAAAVSAAATISCRHRCGDSRRYRPLVRGLTRRQRRRLGPAPRIPAPAAAS